ncbi:MAG TPA: hypothetical protein VH640_06935 [Bryobacteraceae bacterium]
MPQTTTTVTIDGILPFVELHLLDASLSPMPLLHDLWRTTTRLAPGAYVARFSTSAWRRDESFLVLPGEGEMTVSPGNLDSALVRSAVPLAGTHAYVAEHAKAVAAATQRKPAEATGWGPDGSLLVVLRPATAAAGSGICLFSASGEEIPIGKFTVAGLPPSVQAMSIALPEGAYQLHIARGNGAGMVCQPVFVVAGRQTRAFLLDESAGSEPDKHSWAAARMSIQFAPAGEVFQPSSSYLLAAEELMNLVERDALVRPAPEWSGYVREANCASLDLAFCLAELDPWRESAPLESDIVARLRHRLGAVADAAVVSQVAEAAQKEAFEASAGGDDGAYRLWEPPMSTRAWDLALFGETRNSIVIPSESPAVREATRALSAGPWLRFSVKAQDLPGLAVNVGRTAPSADLSCSEPEEILRSLREFVTREVVARIQFGSAGFSVAERRFLTLVCPRADTTVFRILKEAEESNRAMRAGEGRAFDFEELPSEDRMVQSLRLPRAAIWEVAVGAIEKLADRTLLPTSVQLQAFINAESNEEAVLLEPLELLRHASSGMVHVSESEPLSLLSILYLRYRSGLAPAKIASLLNSLGFQERESRRPVRSSDITRALRDAVEMLTNFHKIDCSPEGGVWEDIEVSLRPPKHYKEGQLFIVKRRTSPGTLTPEQEREWERNAMSYSISLGVARQRGGLDDLELMTQSERSQGSGSREAAPSKAERNRYEAEVRSLEKATTEDLAMVVGGTA